MSDRIYRPRLTEEEYELIQGIRDACEEHGVGLEHIPDGWLKSKGSSLRFKNPSFGREVSLSEIREAIGTQLDKSFTPIKQEATRGEGVLKWADLHFGAYIRNLVITQDFDAEILRSGLMDSVSHVNDMKFKKVHVHLHGDLIESFTGMNHATTWMEMDINQIGANSVILCCRMLEQVLSQIKNLDTIKIVAGNHDRTSSRNDEDVRGGAAELIAWGLQKSGFNVEFHPMVITHQVEGINHILLHGHFKLSKKSTEDILWKYGKKGVYNFIAEGHLHSMIEKASVSARSKMTKISDDGIDKRRMNLPSFFPGNYYSEGLGFDTNPGYVLIWDNGKGKPNVFNGSV